MAEGDDRVIPYQVTESMGEDAWWCDDCQGYHAAGLEHYLNVDASPVVMNVATFSDPQEVRSSDGETEFSLITCNLCGCALIMDMLGSQSTLDLHTEWHHNG